MVVCIYYVHQFRCSIYDHLAFNFFFRYFDNLRAVVVCRLSDIITKSLSFSLLENLQTLTYHPSMSLILEECSQNTFKFLEGQFLKSTMTFMHMDITNFYFLQQYGKIKFSLVKIISVILEIKESCEA